MYGYGFISTDVFFEECLINNSFNIDVMMLSFLH